MNPAMEARIRIIEMMMKNVAIASKLDAEMKTNPQAVAWVLLTIGAQARYAKTAMDILNQPHVVAAPAGRCIFY